jgi:hypothetical protein
MILRRVGANDQYYNVDNRSAPAYNRQHYALATFTAVFEIPAGCRGDERWSFLARESISKEPSRLRGLFRSWLRPSTRAFGAAQGDNTHAAL